MLLKPTGSAGALSDPTVMAPAFRADLPGTYVLQLTVRDDIYTNATDTVAVTATVRMVSVPDVVGMAQAAAEAAITAALLTVGAVTTAHSADVPVGDVISQDPSAGGTAIAAGTAVDLVVSIGPVPLPPDPGSVAPALGPTIATPFAVATDFLYTGLDPIQTGVAPGAIVANRAAVLRGKVQSRDGTPLSGVKISILNHPEYGQTLSRADGMFDIAVNSGLVTVVYAKEDGLGAQRQIQVTVHDRAY